MVILSYKANFFSEKFFSHKFHVFLPRRGKLLLGYTPSGEKNISHRWAVLLTLPLLVNQAWARVRTLADEFLLRLRTLGGRNDPLTPYFRNLLISPGSHVQMHVYVPCVHKVRFQPRLRVYSILSVVAI